MCKQKPAASSCKKLTASQVLKVIRGSSQAGKPADSHGRQQRVPARVEQILQLWRNPHGSKNPQTRRLTSAFKAWPLQKLAAGFCSQTTIPERGLFQAAFKTFGDYLIAWNL